MLRRRRLVYGRADAPRTAMHALVDDMRTRTRNRSPSSSINNQEPIQVFPPNLKSKPQIGDLDRVQLEVPLIWGILNGRIYAFEKTSHIIRYNPNKIRIYAHKNRLIPHMRPHYPPMRQVRGNSTNKILG